VNGESTSVVSVWQLGFLLPAIFAALIFGKLMVNGMSNRTAVLIAGVAIFIGMIWLAFFNAATSYWLFCQAWSFSERDSQSSHCRMAT